MDALVLVGRLLFALLFLGSGLAHLQQRRAMSGYAASKGVPAAQVLVVLSGVQLVLGATMVALGIWPDLGALLLLAFLLPTALVMHPFWKESDPMARQTEQIQFLKDLSLAGAALVMFALFAHLGPDLGLVLVEPLFELS